MKENIKRILREDIEKNMLGVTVSNPNQELIVMRGIPGAGKSTEAKELKGNGEIFSTDDRIESQGDYRDFFASMISSGDFSPLGKMHNLNFNMAKEAMENGVTPVIIDNTNIKANEPKNYVEAALKMGYADSNIKFVDVGTGGLSAEELAQRNTHGVPLDKIKSMIQSHKSVGPLSLEKVVKAKPMFNNKIKMFASVVLDDTSKSKLLKAIGHMIPEGWDVIAHHMTINFGKGLPEDLKDDLGKMVQLRAVSVGLSDMAMAVGVEGYHSDNAKPHITIAVNRSEGGKPVMSNDISNWDKLDSPINLSGKVTEEKL
jgi:predicted kinase